MSFDAYRDVGSLGEPDEQQYGGEQHARKRLERAGLAARVRGVAWGRSERGGTT